MIIKKMDSKREEIEELETLLKSKLTSYQRFMIERELKAMRSGVYGEKDFAYYIDFYFGMRRGEMFKLTWEEIDFQRNFIRLREPKGGDDQTIPMNEFARQLLLNRPRFKDSPHVFPGRQGKELNDINHALAEIKRAAGLPKDFRTLHGLRHVFASMLASSGQVDMYTLQKLLTHKSPVMTQRYAHLGMKP